MTPEKNNPFLVNRFQCWIRDVHRIASITELLIFTFQFVIFLEEKSIVTIFVEFCGDAPFSMLELQHRDLEYVSLNLSEYSPFDWKFDRISDAMIPKSTVPGARRNDRHREFDEQLFDSSLRFTWAFVNFSFSRSSRCCRNCLISSALSSDRWLHWVWLSCNWASTSSSF